MPMMIRTGRAIRPPRGDRGGSRQAAMSAIVIGMIVFAGVFGGALLGMVVRRLLPDDHVSTDSKDIVKLAFD